MSTHRIPDDRLEQFEAWVNDPDVDVVEKLWPEVNPDMAAREHARKASLITLASAEDMGSERMRCHTLLVGPPGSGKSAIRDWVKDAFPHAVGIGPDSTDAGLKGDASGNDLTPGALSQAHGGFLLVEELDKFAKSERDALYESMGKGSYEINKGEIHEDIPAAVRTIACANSTENFKPAFLDRFDFVLRLDEYDADETDQVSRTILDNQWAAAIEGDISRDGYLLPQYLDLARDYHPGGDRETLERIHKMREHVIHDTGFTGDIRTKSAYFRVAFTLARLNRRDITPYDFARAIKLIHPGDVGRSTLVALKAIADGDELDDTL